MNPIEQDFPQVDWDNCFFVSSEDCAVYFDVFEDRQKRWFMFADINTEHFTSELCGGDGPYETENDAIKAGINCAVDWFTDNEIVDFDYSSNIPKDL